jgi:hypothetical protein
MQVLSVVKAFSIDLIHRHANLLKMILVPESLAACHIFGEKKC